MNSRERLAIAMGLGTADRVPLMCQIATGHYFLHSGVSPQDIWFTSEGFAEALVRLCRRYRFDGILVNLPGRDPEWTRHLDRVERIDKTLEFIWNNGDRTTLPSDDLPHYRSPQRIIPTLEEIDPERLFYVEPWDLTGIKYPFTWSFEKEERPHDDFFPPYHLDTIRAVRQKVSAEVSVHGEVFSPWSQFLEFLGYEQALMGIMDDPGKVSACLESLTEGAICLGIGLAQSGADAVLISSAFAGGGFISRAHYQEFVLPYERELIRRLRESTPIPVYTHTCGEIGDRLDLMLATGTNGIDTLDPPPLGTVDLAEAKKALKGKAFIKGNIDPVGVLLAGPPEVIEKDVEYRLRIGKPEGGYILSTACSVAPATPPGHLEMLATLVDSFGVYQLSE